MVEKEKKMNFVKVVSGLLAVILIIVFVLAILSVIDWVIFWGVIIVVAIYTYVVLPRLKK
jgi:hypothetical protein